MEKSSGPVYIWRRDEPGILRRDKKETLPLREMAKNQELDGAGTEKNVASILQEMDNLIGLECVKQLVREVYALVEISRRRREHRLNTDSVVLHMVFKGNPGTGKTTVARLLGRLLAELKVLPKGHLTEVERADLVGEYIGHTALKTREQLKKAMGGVLFVDEAYSLNRGGEKDFGKEAIDTLVKAMEDHKNEFVLILAGYRREMETFMRTNPGLESRFPIHITFPDYTSDELLEIANSMLAERQYCLSGDARDFLARYLGELVSAKKSNFSNARMVRNLLERAIRRQALRLVASGQNSREELMLIRKDDFFPLEEENRGTLFFDTR